MTVNGMDSAAPGGLQDVSQGHQLGHLIMISTCLVLDVHVELLRLNKSDKMFDVPTVCSSVITAFITCWLLFAQQLKGVWSRLASFITMIIQGFKCPQTMVCQFVKNIASSLSLTTILGSYR